MGSRRKKPTASKPASEQRPARSLIESRGGAIGAEEVGETFSFVAKEMLRLQRLGLDVVKELQGLDFVCSIHDSDRRMRFIGRPAYDRLRDLTLRAIDQSAYRGCIDHSRAFGCVRTGFGRDYIRPGFTGTTDAEDLTNLLGWIDEAAEDCTSLTHFVPCQIRLPKGERFVVGPVTFEPRETVMGVVEAKLADWDAGRGDEDKWRAKDCKTALEYLGSFTDVARVTVPRCDHETSRRVADETVQAALAFLHVMAGADRTKKVRSGGPAVKNAQLATLALDDQGAPFYTWTGEWEGARLDEKFWEWMRAKRQAAMSDAVGKALQTITERTDAQMAAARYLDAAAWYADAARETRHPAAILKYLTAMERLLWTGETGGVTRRLSERAAALCFTVDPWNFEELTKEIRSAYDLRSGIVHGRIRNDDPKIVRNYRLCERIAQDLLITWLDRYGEGFDRETTLEKLKAHLDGFVAEVRKETEARRAIPLAAAGEGIAE